MMTLTPHICDDPLMKGWLRNWF